VAYWLLKTEPSDYSYPDLERDGRTVWDGVANNAALLFLRQVRRGDLCLVYHTGSERAVVGRARAISDPYPDPGAGDPRLAVFDLEALTRFARPVSLDTMKRDPAFAGFELLRQPRLSVLPVPEAMWRRILSLGDQ
jgi:predicted RNA-binding protein with PUA-like domain